MRIEELINTRRTIHSYSNEKIPFALIQNAIEMAIMAPNHRLTFPWRFYGVGLNLRAKIENLQVEMKSKKAPLSEVAEKALRKKFAEGSELLIVGIKKNLDEVQKEDYASLAAGLQNMALFLWEKGYGTKWSTGKVTTHPQIYQAIEEVTGETMSDIELCGFLWIGKPAQVPATPERPDWETFYKPLP